MRGLLVLILSLAIGGTARDAVWRVPGTHATISAALQAAGPGDVILVGPGIYREILVWPVVDGIRLIGVEGWARTVIDAQTRDRRFERWSRCSPTRQGSLLGATRARWVGRTVLFSASASRYRSRNRYRDRGRDRDRRLKQIRRPEIG